MIECDGAATTAEAKGRMVEERDKRIVSVNETYAAMFEQAEREVDDPCSLRECLCLERIQRGFKSIRELRT